MEVKRIMCLTDWQNNLSIEHQNVEILAKLEDGYIYSVIIRTCQNLEYLMYKEKKKESRRLNELYGS